MRLLGAGLHSALLFLFGGFRAEGAPGSQRAGPLSVSSSPPALELLLPAPVYSASLSKASLITQTNSSS